MSWKHEHLLEEPPSLRAHIEFLIAKNPGSLVEACKFYLQEVPGCGLLKARQRVIQMRKQYLGVSE